MKSFRKKTNCNRWKMAVIHACTQECPPNECWGTYRDLWGWCRCTPAGWQPSSSISGCASAAGRCRRGGWCCRWWRCRWTPRTGRCRGTAGPAFTRLSHMCRSVEGALCWSLKPRSSCVIGWCLRRMRWNAHFLLSPLVPPFLLPLLISIGLCVPHGAHRCAH